MRVVVLTLRVRTSTGQSDFLSLGQIRKAPEDRPRKCIFPIKILIEIGSLQESTLDFFLAELRTHHGGWRVSHGMVKFAIRRAMLRARRQPVQAGVLRSICSLRKLNRSCSLRGGTTRT